VTKLSDSYGVLQAAGRGGQGASKNMIGTKGEDKVIILKLFSLPVKISMLTISCHLTKLEFSESFKKYFVARFFVPIGTVVHLIEGEIPSVVEKHYLKELDPWEIPGTLVDNIPEPNQGSSYSDPKVAVEVGIVPTNGCSSTRTEGNVEISTGMKRNTLCSSADTLSQFSSSYNTSKMCTKEIVKKEEMEEKEQTLYSVAELTEKGQQIIVA